MYRRYIEDSPDAANTALREIADSTRWGVPRNAPVSPAPLPPLGGRACFIATHFWHCLPFAATFLILSLTGCSHPQAALDAYHRGDYAVARQAYQQDRSAEAAFALGVMAYKGDGQPRDLLLARQQFLLAAQQGHAGAQYNLGLMAGSGESVPKDLPEAARWYRLAAEQGYARAQYNLGLMHVYGDGVAQDRREALRWLVKAAKQGHRKAQEQLELLLAERLKKAKQE